MYPAAVRDSGLPNNDAPSAELIRTASAAWSANMSTPACADDVPQPLAPVSGTCGVDFIGVECDLYWSPSHSDDETPPPVKRRASALGLPNNDVATAELICSNCRLRPVGSDSKKCGFDDWCSVCDESLWATNPEKDVPSAELICRYCRLRPVGSDSKKCGYDDWCSVCDEALWAHNPENSTVQELSLLRWPRSLCRVSPFSLPYLVMMHELRNLEAALSRAQDPDQMHDVIVDAEIMSFKMKVFGDRGLQPRVSRLTSRALVAILQHGYLVVRRCAELADECRAAGWRLSHLQPSFEVIQQAIIAADRVLNYLHSDLKTAYIQEIRPILVRSTMDSESEYDSDSEPAAKRLCLCGSGARFSNCPSKENHSPGACDA